MAAINRNYEFKKKNHVRLLNFFSVGSKIKKKIAEGGK